MKCMLCMLQEGLISIKQLQPNKMEEKKDELVHFNVAPFLSARVYQGYALHCILIYFHIIKYWHQKAEIMERSRKLFFFLSFCLYLFSHPIVRLVLRRETEFTATS